MASLVPPYRHARLSAVKLDTEAFDPGLRENAALEELQAEMMKHLERLAPVLDLRALAALSDGVANRDVPQGAAGR